MTASHASAPPTVAEDVLLLLFRPESGTFRGENTLFYVIGGAVLAQLALEDRVTTSDSWGGAVAVNAVRDRMPVDELLRDAWQYVSDKPRGVQTVLPAIGPPLREPLIERLITRGYLTENRKKVLGLIPSRVLREGDSARRDELVAAVRGVLVDGAEATPRVAALTGLIWASGALPEFDPVIPWNSAVITRAEELKRGNWGAAGAGEAVERTVTATILNSLMIATLPRE